MKSFSCTNIVKQFHVVQRREITYLVMEDASGWELLDSIMQSGPLEESKTQRIFAQLVHGLQYCHDHYIVHIYIKASNTLINCRGKPSCMNLAWLLKWFLGRSWLVSVAHCPTVPQNSFKKRNMRESLCINGVCLSYGGLLRREIMPANISILPHISIDIFNVTINMLIVIPCRRPNIHWNMKRSMIRTVRHIYHLLPHGLSQAPQAQHCQDHESHCI